MSGDSEPYLPFSQRTGLAQIPPQLRLGEVSSELRRLLDYYITLEISRASEYDGCFFESRWKRVAMDMHVRFFKLPVASFKDEPDHFLEGISDAIRRYNVGPLFDLIEFLVRHPSCSTEMKRDLTSAFVEARAAYRIVDNSQIVAIGTQEQAEAFERAVAATEVPGSGAARSHLIAAGVALRTSDWTGCVRESIHAVEATAVRLAPGTDTLGPALNALEQRGHLHGALKNAFSALYGYASDEEGIRHALVLKDAAQVDEADALFILGACASFVSYLMARDAQ